MRIRLRDIPVLIVGVGAGLGVMWIGARFDMPSVVLIGLFINGAAFLYCLFQGFRN
jgi:hypothetical protein